MLSCVLSTRPMVITRNCCLHVWALSCPASPSVLASVCDTCSCQAQNKHHLKLFPLHILPCLHPQQFASLFNSSSFQVSKPARGATHLPAPWNHTPASPVEPHTCLPMEPLTCQTAPLELPASPTQPSLNLRKVTPRLAQDVWSPSGAVSPFLCPFCPELAATYCYV